MIKNKHKKFKIKYYYNFSHFFQINKDTDLKNIRHITLLQYFKINLNYLFFF